MNYQQATEWIFNHLPVYQNVGKSAYNPDLSNAHQLMELLEHPQKSFKSVHIAGTNGKGSVAHLMASVFQEAEYKTGLFTSPHLKDYRERIRIDGKMISEEAVIEFVENYKDHLEKMALSFYEMTVALAFWYFRKQGVEYAILETGLGGRLDTTNVVLPELAVITNIGLDHQHILGNTLAEIAAEKAGIIKENKAVLIGETQAEIKDVFLNKAQKLNAPIEFADEEYQIEKIGEEYCIKGMLLKINLHVPLQGAYQQKNILTAFAACRILGIELERIMMGFYKVLESTSLQGRWQILQNKPKVICDTAHNTDGLSWVIKQLLQESYKKLHIVLGMVNDKSLDLVLQHFPKDANYYFCKANISRALDAVELQQKAKEHQLKGNPYKSITEAYEFAQQQATANDLIFVGGSTFVVAEVL